MPNTISSNRFYNNDQLGQAFSNLAQAFAPPSGGDLAGYATAKAKREEALRLAEVFNYAHDPNYDKTRADQLATAAGVYAPNQSYYSVDQGNLTSRQNNTADNARAVLTNGADNDRAIEQTKLTNSKDLSVAMLTPVAKDATRFVPKGIADLYGTPERQIGVVSAQPGEVNTLPDGRIIRGDAKPLGETEWQAQQNERLRQSGQLSDQMMIDAVMGKNTPVTVLKDNVPTYMNPGEAERTGVPAFIANKETAKVTNGQALIDGRGVPVYQAPGDGAWRTQDGKPIPSNVPVTNLPTPTGSNADLNLGPTQTNVTSANSLNATLDMAEYTATKAKQILQNNPNAAGIVSRFKGLGQSVVGSLKQVLDTAEKTDPNAPIDLNKARDYLAEATKVVGEYDPDVVRMFSLVADMAYTRAQINNPQGEVSRQAFERALESFGQGLFASQQDLATGIDSFMQDTIPGGRVKAKSLLGQANTADTSAPTISAPRIREGATATNSKTGQKLIFRNGAWEAIK